MTKREFNEWIKGHYLLFPEAEKWAAELSRPKEVRQLWVEMLANVTLEDAQAASKALYARPTDASWVPYSKHCRWVCDWAEQQRLQAVRRTEYQNPHGSAGSCEKCKGSGRLRVAGTSDRSLDGGKVAEVIRSAGSEKEARKKGWVHDFVVRCNCPAGAGWENFQLFQSHMVAVDGPPLMRDKTGFWSSVQATDDLNLGRVGK